MENSIQDILFAKSGKAVIAIAAEFIKYEAGTKMPTISYLQNCYPSFSRGTIQNAIKTLTAMEAITIDTRHSQGTFLKNKNSSLLLKLMGIDFVVGCMPLPYSKRYEGLATGLTASIENQYDISSSLEFVRGAKNRIAMLMSNRCDYAIMSLMAAKEMMSRMDDLQIIKEFGPQSYTSDHVIVFHDNKEKCIKEGMRVGVDGSSIDHKNLVEQVCRDIDVKFVNLSYSNVLKAVMLGEIDCTVWNKDEIFEKYMDVNYVSIAKNSDDTVAVMVVNKNREGLSNFLMKAIDENIVLENQRRVIDGLILPTY